MHHGTPIWRAAFWGERTVLIWCFHIHLQRTFCKLSKKTEIVKKISHWMDTEQFYLYRKWLNNYKRSKERKKKKQLQQTITMINLRQKIEFGFKYMHTHTKIWRDSESEIMKWMHRTKQLGKITNHIQKKDEEKDLQQRQNAIESESKQTGKEWDGRSTCKN